MCYICFINQGKLFFVIISVVRTEDWKVKPFLDLNYKSSPCRWWDLEPGGWRKVGQTRSRSHFPLSELHLVQQGGTTVISPPHLARHQTVRQTAAEKVRLQLQVLVGIQQRATKIGRQRISG